MKLLQNRSVMGDGEGEGGEMDDFLIRQEALRPICIRNSQHKTTKKKKKEISHFHFFHRNLKIAPKYLKPNGNNPIDIIYPIDFTWNSDFSFYFH